MLEESDLELVVSRLQGKQAGSVGMFLLESSSTVWVASGLAKIPAVYGASLMQKIVGAPSRFVSPLEYVQNQRIRCLPVLISLRGEHADAIEVAHAIADREVERSIIVTCTPSGPAGKVLLDRSPTDKDLATGVASAQLPDRDRRFVNFKSILALSGITNRLVSHALNCPEEMKVDLRDLRNAWGRAQQASAKIAEQICSVEDWQQKQLFVLTEGVYSELAIAWQSVLSEAGISNPICLDIKDYTHGDHLVASRTKNAMYLVIGHKELSSVSRAFIERFSTMFPVFSLELVGDERYHFWENIFTVGGSTSEMTRALGYYNERPPKDPVIWSWRGWGHMRED
ncbi:hypothetical protein [Pseudomonas sp. WCS374]|uniref:hypothetical protein n=1 Tax=Pseudomonas sp. WCS374 TaxID=1495331 RepID=UPI00049A40F5|nr:hypothetical protein [Pseudomonas sp. WCS374]AIB42911.1 hypothetical protein PD374_17915 [Pseudomonas sp. WCS374]